MYIKQMSVAVTLKTNDKIGNKMYVTLTQLMPYYFQGIHVTIQPHNYFFGNLSICTIKNIILSVIFVEI